MKTPVLGVLIAALSYLLYSYMSGGPPNIVRVKIGHTYYQVQDLPGKQDAAKLMADIQQRIQKVVDFYKEEHTDEPARLLAERYNPASLFENAMTSSDTSYSENKGEKIVLCLRDKTNTSYPLIEINTCMFVVLHELAHLMTAELDAHSHTREFWHNFRRLLEDSIKLGIYQSVNYAKTPVQYCGMMITDSPL